MLATFLHTGGLTGAEVGRRRRDGVPQPEAAVRPVRRGGDGRVDPARPAATSGGAGDAFAAERARFDAHLPSPGSCPSLADDLRRGGQRGSGLHGRRRMTTTVDAASCAAGRAARARDRPADAAVSRPPSMRPRRPISSASTANRCGRPMPPAPDASGFPGDAYVLALVGGTGVGKSSLLNALAGGDVSPASARRPTTSEPIAWVPRTERGARAAARVARRPGDPRARADGSRPGRDPRPARHGLGRDRAPSPRRGPAAAGRCRGLGHRP